MTERFKIDPVNCNRIAATHLHWLQSDAEGHLCKLSYYIHSEFYFFLRCYLLILLTIQKGCNFSCWSCLLG